MLVSSTQPSIRVDCQITEVVARNICFFCNFLWLFSSTPINLFIANIVVWVGEAYSFQVQALFFCARTQLWSSSYHSSQMHINFFAIEVNQHEYNFFGILKIFDTHQLLHRVTMKGCMLHQQSFPLNPIILQVSVDLEVCDHSGSAILRKEFAKVKKIKRRLYTLN